jgi:hypothetical protein
MVLVRVRGLERRGHVVIAVDHRAVEELVRMHERRRLVDGASVHEVVVDVALLHEQAGVGDARETARRGRQLEGLHLLGRQIARALREMYGHAKPGQANGLVVLGVAQPLGHRQADHHIQGPCELGEDRARTRHVDQAFLDVESAQRQRQDGRLDHGHAGEAVRAAVTDGEGR